jgi:hypothetical protein
VGRHTTTSVPIEVTPTDSDDWKIEQPSFPVMRPAIITMATTATFEAYLDTLDPWEIDILWHVTMDVDPLPYAWKHKPTSGQ